MFASASPILPETNQDVDALKNKRQFSTCFWITLSVSILVIVLTAIGLGVYFGIFMKKTHDAETPKIYETYRILRDVPLPGKEGEPSSNRLILFSGKVPHKDMLNICNIIDKDNPLPLELFGKAYSNQADEGAFDTIIRSNDTDGSVFDNLPDQRKLLWTGCFYRYDKKKQIWKDSCKTTVPLLTEFNNFCNKADWQGELAKLQSKEANEWQSSIYIVKDYGNLINNGCWRFSLPKELLTLMDTPKAEFPSLPFVCIATK